MRLEAPLVGMSLLLFPGAEAGGSDPLRPVEGCVTGLTEELSSYRWTSGPQWEAGTNFWAEVDLYQEVNEIWISGPLPFAAIYKVLGGALDIFR